MNSPLSMREISSTSSMSSCKLPPLTRIFSRHSFIFPGSSACCKAMFVKPMMTFIGVRMSCDMRERNSDFASFARRAASAALIRSFSRRFSSL